LDPSVERQVEKAERSHTFETVAREWLGKLHLKADTVAQLRHRLEIYVFPHLGRYPTKTVSASDLLRVSGALRPKARQPIAYEVSETDR
jgi:hypothetical protein